MTVQLERFEVVVDDATIADLRIHARSREPEARPLLLDDISIPCLTGTINSSMRRHYETRRPALSVEDASAGLRAIP